MNRNRKIVIITCFLWTLGIVWAFAQKKPNMVIIISDDHAYQTIGAYGGMGRTPNIDKIAKNGATFHKAYVNNSICGPARAALLTGKYSHKNGFKDNETSNFDFGQNTFVKELQKTGYKTAWVGKIHLGHELQGFDYFDILEDQGHYFNSDFISAQGKVREEGYVSDVITDKAVEWLEGISSDEPFCLIIGHKATHRTWMPDPQDFGKYDADEFEVPVTFWDGYEGRKAAQVQEMSIHKDMRMAYDLKMFESAEEMFKDSNFKRMNATQKKQYLDYYLPIYKELEKSNLSEKELAAWKYRRYMIDYLTTAESMDRNIGRVLDYLKINELEDNTMVIYLSDQGFYMGEHGWFDKRFMYEESFRTPLLISMPGLITPGSQANAQLINVDIAPTLLDVAGVEIPKDMQGESFLNVLRNPSRPHRENLYYHYYENGEHAVSPHFGVSDGRYKLIRFYKRVETWELYDLKNDPQEMKNLYPDKQYQEIVEKMKKKLHQEIRRFDDQEAKEILIKEI